MQKLWPLVALGDEGVRELRKEPVDAPPTPLPTPTPVPPVPEPTLQVQRRVQGQVQRSTPQVRPDTSGSQSGMGDAAADTIDVWITWYTCPPYCGAMANGVGVYDGAAACGYGFDLGQRFSIDGDPTARIYTCEDRGGGPARWVDIFFADAAAAQAWQAVVGSYGKVRLR